MIPENNRIRIPKNSHIEPEVSSPDTKPTGKKSLPEGKIVGKVIGKNSPSEGLMIYNEETKKWDFVPNSKD